MKRLIYLLYLSLLALILVSCEKETVVPATALTEDDNARGAACQAYQYQLKNGIYNLGIARNDYVLVGFANNVMPAQQQAILAQFSVVDQISSDVFMDSGIITVVRLNSSANCQAVENLVASLERKPQVKFAAPVFDDAGG